MKKSLVFTAVACLFALNSQAQNADYRNTISAHTGFNSWQIAARLDNVFNNNVESAVGVSLTATPTFALGYDRAINNWFSLGGSVSYNQGHFKADQITATINEQRYEGSIDYRRSRTNLGVRAMFHYANSGRIDLYSGVRLGVNINRNKVQLDSEQFPDEDVVEQLTGFGFNGFRPTFQVVPIGFRGYVTPNLGIGLETSIGVPYIVSANINDRF
jgi:opacity protein-like surface antigen